MVAIVPNLRNSYLPCQKAMHLFISKMKNIAFDFIQHQYYLILA